MGSISPLNKALGKLLALLRCAADLKQSEVAERAGLTQPVISAMEKGKSLSLNNLEGIAELYGMSLSELIAHAENRLNNKRGIF